MVKLSAKFRVLLLLSAAALLVFVIAKVAAIKNDAAHELAKARAENLKKDEIPFTKTVRQPIDRREIQIWQSTQNVRAVARFKNSIFIASDGGLVHLSDAGERQKHYTVLDGLPESDLTALAVFAGKLFIGTVSSGLVAFDGERFEHYRWQDRDAKSINALFADNGRLLIGTFAGGLIEFDGIRFREIKAQDASIKSINFLAKDAEILFVGTFDNGLWFAEAGRWRRFTVAEGLPSNRIVGVVKRGSAVFVGTDLGVAQADTQELSANDSKPFHLTASIPTLSSLTFFNNQILAARDDGTVFQIENNRNIRNLEWNKPEISNAHLASENSNLWLFGNSGVWLLRERNSFGVAFSRFGGNFDETLSNNIISALAIDRQNRVWTGTFRNGIDVLTGDGTRLKHLENENLREINALLAQNQMLAATAHGVVAFDDSFRPQILTKNNGLLSNSVMHIAAREKARFFATSRGLSFTANNNLRALTSAHGLPSDNAYTALVYKNALYVGTLGGLAQIENNRVVRTFKDSNSKLTHNWVSALCAGGERLFVGTYGGGVFELTAANELHAFAPETGKFAVNPNAMFSDGARLYVGTLDGARILDLNTQRWTHLTDELPAKTVLSVTGDGENIYFGTTNGIARINKNFWLDKATDE